MMPPMDDGLQPKIAEVRAKRWIDKESTANPPSHLLVDTSLSADTQIEDTLSTQ
jgi:hypothetical protein